MSVADVATVARTLRAIESLAEQPLTVAEMSRILEVDRGTATRLLVTLERAGYAERGDQDGRYRIAPTRIIALYGLVEGRTELTQQAAPILADLRDHTNETANVSVLVGDEMMYVAVQRSRAAVCANFGLGRHVAVHHSAIGKAYIACLPQERLDALLDRAGLAMFTPRTIVTRQALQAHLETVRRLGYAVDDEEGELGMRCVAAPVRDFTGRVIASLGISGPSTRLTLERVHELAVPVVAAARRLSVTLGWEARAGDTDARANGTAEPGRSAAASPSRVSRGGRPSSTVSAS